MVVLERVAGDLSGARELFDMAQAEADDDTLAAVGEDALTVEAAIAQLEFRRMFCHEMDPAPCFIEINAGAGGTEAQDWASMIERMYLRYCERRGF